MKMTCGMTQDRGERILRTEIAAHAKGHGQNLFMHYRELPYDIRRRSGDSRLKSRNGFRCATTLVPIL